MNIWELATIAAVGIVVAFAFGFIFGMNYQSTEDRKLVRHARAAIRRAQKIVRECKTQSTEWNEDWSKFAEDDIKYGGF